MYEAYSATKGEFLDREAKYEAVSAQNVSYLRVLSITIFMPASVGQARISGNNSFFCCQIFLKKMKENNRALS